MLLKAGKNSAKSESQKKVLHWLIVMDKGLSLEQGASLVRLARKSISYTLASGVGLTELCEDRQLLELRGAFVTLLSFTKRELLGCIGLPFPVKPLWYAVSEMAVEAALHDPRFEPLKRQELESVLVEVSVLSEPEEILGDKREIPKKIGIGSDGLIVQRESRSGLLLPQVALEQNWNAKQFLENCCLKAGLMENMWLSKETKVLKFRAQVFSETRPNGSVEEKTG